MKVKVSKKEVKENFRNIICIGYCDLQYLLYYKEANYYSSGVYGWSCDYYKINNNTIISTGYQPIGNICADYNKVVSYDKEARNIIYNYSYDYEVKKELLEELLNKFIKDVLESEEK